MFIVDFDDTIFDTASFKEARLVEAKKLGIPEDLFLRTYKDSFKNQNGEVVYSNQRHAEELSKYGYDNLSTLKVLEKLDLKSFLIDDTIIFLNFLKNTGEPVILLSLGEPNFHRMKVEGAGIYSYFDKIIFVNKDKKDVLKDLLKDVPDEKVWLFNDKVYETLEIQKKFPKVNIVLKKSRVIPEEDYKQSGLPYFNTLTEITKYVRQSI